VREAKELIAFVERNFDEFAPYLAGSECKLTLQTGDNKAWVSYGHQKGDNYVPMHRNINVLRICFYGFLECLHQNEVSLEEGNQLRLPGKWGPIETWPPLIEKIPKKSFFNYFRFRK